MNDKIKWGVLGSGGIARRRIIPEEILAAAAAAELVAAFDVNPTINSEVAREFGAVAVDSLDELLNADIDAVYVASPANLHYEHTVAAAIYGKHVLCENLLV